MDEGTPEGLWATGFPAKASPGLHHMPDSDRHPVGPVPTFFRPFAAVPRVGSYHPATAIEAARADLERAVRRGEGFGVVVAPPGTGKTQLLAVLADRLRGDFDVALLAGARICTRRALWQSILAELGEPYRGLEEGDLRMAVVERVRTLAASASGLVLLLDEAHTLPERLLEEIRLLSGLPTPIPAVHVVLSGTLDLEERLASPRHESLMQRIAVRCALGRLDHAETTAYLRTQCNAASLRWEERFAPGCEDAVFTISDGVPRVINQVCDRSLRLAEERADAGSGVVRVVPGDIEEAWRRIQQLPTARPLDAPMAKDCGSDRLRAGDGGFGGRSAGCGGPVSPEGGVFSGRRPEEAVVEFGMLDEEAWVRRDRGCDRRDWSAGSGSRRASPAGDLPLVETASVSPEPSQDPWEGPDVELLFDAAGDPFEEMFESVERVAGRLLVRGTDDFVACPRVVSEEGVALARQIDAWRSGNNAARAESAVESVPPIPGVCGPAAACPHEAVGMLPDEQSDRDLFVIEEDDEPLASPDPLVFAVRPADYRGLFARLRRGI